MKNHLLLSIICIGLGIAIGWVANNQQSVTPKSSTQATLPKPKQINPSTGSTPKATPSQRIPSVSSAIIVNGQDFTKLSPEDQEALEEGQNRWAKMFEQRQKAKTDARIAKLVSELNLTEQQEAQLRNLLQERASGALELFSGSRDPSRIAEMAKHFRGHGVDDLLSEILTPDQEQAFDQLKARELANKVEAKALKNLAKLSFLDLSQEQKDAAYDLLYEEAETSASIQSPEGSMVSMFTEGAGLEIDVEDLGIAGVFAQGAVKSAEGENPSPADIAQQVRENMNQRIDQKVQALAPILNENQQAAYRQHLESNSGGLFGSFLQMDVEKIE